MPFEPTTDSIFLEYLHGKRCTDYHLDASDIFPFLSIEPLDIDGFDYTYA